MCQPESEINHRVNEEVINKAYDHIVSLGSFCMTAGQIRRRFPSAKAFPFDWLVTPTVALQDMFETDFSEIMLPENMQIVTENAGQAVMCKRYGLMHYHDFYDAKVDDRYVPVAVRAECTKNSGKFAYLLKRLYGLTGDVLFIRVETGYVQHFNNNCDFDEIKLQGFIDILRKFLPKCSVDLLLLNSFPAAKERGVYCDRLDHYGVTTWEGSNQGWDEMFDRNGIDMNPALQVNA